ncbi:MAG: hypothetical protein WD512_14050, partial [Candidatus Paceibacterota bacterium]
LPDPEPELISNRDAIIELSRQTYGNKKSTLRGDSIENKDIRESQSQQPKPSSEKYNKSKPYSKPYNDNSKSYNIPNTPDTIVYPKLEKDNDISKINANTFVESQNMVNNSQVSNIIEEIIPASKQKDSFSSDTEYPNPIMAKKLKEVFSRSHSSYGESEYLIKEKLLKDLNNSSNELSLSMSELIDELLLEVKLNLMVEKEIKKKYMPKSKSIKFDK